MRNFIQVYAPDSSYPGEQYHDFLDLLQLTIAAVQKGEELHIGEISSQKWVTTSIPPGQKLLESLDWTVRMTHDNNCCNFVQ